MPEIEADDFIIADEQTRPLLMAPLGKWSSPTAAGLFHVIGRRIANRAAKQAQATKRYFTTEEAYVELLDRAGDIFIERLGAALSNALDVLADASADAAIEEPPTPKRKRNRSGAVRRNTMLTILSKLRGLHGVVFGLLGLIASGWIINTFTRSSWLMDILGHLLAYGSISMMVYSAVVAIVEWLIGRRAGRRRFDKDLPAPPPE